MPKLKQRLLELLVCPADKGKLDFDEKSQSLSCRLCRRCYNIRDGIPSLIIGGDAIHSSNTDEKRK